MHLLSKSAEAGVQDVVPVDGVADRFGVGPVAVYTGQVGVFPNLFFLVECAEGDSARVSDFLADGDMPGVFHSAACGYHRPGFLKAVSDLASDQRNTLGFSGAFFRKAVPSFIVIQNLKSGGSGADEAAADLQISEPAVFPGVARLRRPGQGQGYEQKENSRQCGLVQEAAFPPRRSNDEFCNARFGHE